MIKIENIETWGFNHAIRGMRNPMASWDKEDSAGSGCFINDELLFHMGDNDLTLMKNLYKASLVNDNHAHRKYLRQIMISMDITAPLYWWKEFDTYKIGVVANSCSTMHLIHKRDLEMDDFSTDHLDSASIDILSALIMYINTRRREFVEKQDKKIWWQIIQLLPNSYNQRRTVTMNYENAIIIIHQREGHRLDEWNKFVRVLKKLPYISELLKEEKK